MTDCGGDDSSANQKVAWLTPARLLRNCRMAALDEDADAGNNFAFAHGTKARRPAQNMKKKIEYISRRLI
jgi:hypothetical protein